MKRVILATSSQHRIKAFSTLGLKFETWSSEVDEYFPGRPDKPEYLVMHLSRLKAESVPEKCNDNAIVFGFDSVAFFNGEILEKPKSKEEAVLRLQKLSGKSFTFYTGMRVIRIGANTRSSKVVATTAFMRKISDAEIYFYLEQDPHFFTYALGFDALHTYGATFIREIRGSYNNILRGIPLEEVMEIINFME